MIKRENEDPGFQRDVSLSQAHMTVILRQV